METNEIVKDILRHRLSQRGYVWQLETYRNDSSNQILLALRNLCEEFRSRYEDSFDQMFGDLPLVHKHSEAEKSFIGIANELFKEGVQWSHIVALFVFVGELVVSYAQKNWTELIDCAAQWLTVYIDKHLMVWIREHGGWESLIEYQNVPAASVASPWPRVKNWVCGVAAGALGVLTLKAILSSKS